MSLSRCLFSGLLLSGSLVSVLANATASFADDVLVMPYVIVGDDLYSVNLTYVLDSNPVDFMLASYSMFDVGIEVPENTPLFAGNVLSIPTVRVNVLNESFQVQLDYIEGEEVFRLLETPLLLASNTDGVLCDYFDSTPNNQESVSITSTSQWTCSDDTRVLTANGIPDHAVGQFPSAANPNTISAQAVAASFSLEPSETTIATSLGGPAGVLGFILNGVKIDPGTGGTCNDSGEDCSLGGQVGSWRIEALGQSSFDFGDDENHAHVQPGGAYHYHGIPEGFVTKQGGNSSTMTLIGWAADGFPLYARYGYRVADDNSSELKSMTGSYQLVSSVSDARPSTDTYPLGTFSQDWSYVMGSGDLDECNGRWGVTPEFPQGIYHYYATDSYPYLQRCVKGAVQTTGGFPPGPPPR